MAEIQPPTYMDGECYTSQQDRLVWSSIICTEGVADRAGGDLLVSPAAVQPPLAVSVASGQAWIQGDTVAEQGVYSVYSDSAKVVTLADSSATDARIDLIVAQVRDSSYTGTDKDWIITAVTGTASPAPAPPPIPASSIVLAQILVPAGATTLSAGNITDTRTQAGMCPQYAAPGSGLVDFQVFSSNGTYTTPANARSLKVRVVGGGGGGGACSVTTAGQAAVGGGGGGGGYVETYFTSPAATYAVVVGGGGAGSAAGSGAAGSPGGNSSFGGAVAGGGAGGSYGFALTGNGFSSNGGAGGSATGGVLMVGGAYGVDGRVLNGEPFVFGIGGTSVLSSGANQPGLGTDGLGGRQGLGPGAGGSGAFRRQNGSPGFAGGPGINGLVIVEAYN